MVWQQWRAIQVEAAERARTQSAWILSGALDWARLILREDASNGGVDHLGEPWAVPLAEARLSTFLAADKDNTTDDAPDAFLSGAITDANGALQPHQPRQQQARRPARDGDAAAPVRDGRGLGRRRDADRRRHARCDAAAAGRRFGQRPRAAAPPSHGAGRSAAPAALGRPSSPGSASMPEALRSARALRRRSCPSKAGSTSTPAPREVLAAAITGLDLATAERIVQARQRAPIKSSGRPERARARRCPPAASRASRSARASSRSAAACASATSCSSSARWCSGAASTSSSCSASASRAASPVGS